MEMQQEPLPVEEPAPATMEEAAVPLSEETTANNTADVGGAQEMPAVENMTIEGQEGQKHTDQPMEVDDSMNTTITASTVGPLPEFQPSNGYAPEQHHRPQTSYSDTTYSPRYSHADAHYNSRFATSSDADTPPRHGYYKDAQMGRSQSRPNSQMGYRAQSENGGSYQEQNQRNSQPQQEAATKNTSVVIKVGMVGDAQIGKTSLMVKYVEGSWDEDYIQTLGMPSTCFKYGA